MDRFEFTDDILKLCLYGNMTTDKTLLQDIPSVPLPHQVRIGPSTLPGCRFGVFAKTFIRTGTEMGPFVGHVRSPNEIERTNHNPSLWEVFDSSGRLLHFVDGGHTSPVSWLSVIQCARSETEQNLDVIQIGGNIYFKASKDIVSGQELLVWYSLTHSLFMGLPLDNMPGSNYSLDFQSKEPKSKSKTTGRMKCVLCRRGFNSRSNLRSHMRIHTLEKPFSCKYCSRRFSQSSTLRNHVRLHTGEKPYSCTYCKSSYSQLAGLRAHQRSARHRPPSIG